MVTTFPKEFKNDVNHALVREEKNHSHAHTIKLKLLAELVFHMILKPIRVSG